MGYWRATVTNHNCFQDEIGRKLFLPYRSECLSYALLHKILNTKIVRKQTVDWASERGRGRYTLAFIVCGPKLRLVLLTEPNGLFQLRIISEIMNAFRRFVKLPACGISPSQYLYLHRRAQHKKSHTSGGIRRQDPSFRAMETHVPERAAAVIGIIYTLCRCGL
jgi:hypothetical protein